MNTTTKSAEQDLKAERVQEELAAEQAQTKLAVPVRKELLFTDVADEPFWVSLKAERVQQPALLADQGPQQLTSSLELTISQKQPMTIETAGSVIRLHGPLASASASKAA
jgi:hypothetical protein